MPEWKVKGTLPHIPKRRLIKSSETVPLSNLLSTVQVWSHSSAAILQTDLLGDAILEPLANYWICWTSTFSMQKGRQLGRKDSSKMNSMLLHSWTYTFETSVMDPHADLGVLSSYRTLEHPLRPFSNSQPSFVRSRTRSSWFLKRIPVRHSPAISSSTAVQPRY